MKIYPSKRVGLQLLLSAGMGCFLSQCALPPEGPYAKAEWTVHTTDTKDAASVGVQLEKIVDEEMPPLEEIAKGLPSKKGSRGWSEGNSLNADSLPSNEPPLPGGLVGTDHQYHDNLLAPEVDPLSNDVPGATPLPEPVTIARLEPSNPEMTLPSASHPLPEAPPTALKSLPSFNPEHAASLMAQNSRPPVAPRGVNLPPDMAPKQLSANATNSATVSVKKSSPSAELNAPVETPAPATDLSEILKLAKRVESSPR